jgi:DNA (cytosine-5)-methyltransferase 1
MGHQRKHYVASTFALDNRMTVVLFAGMGGGCDGLEWAGFPVHVAINHDPVAVAVHELRHPHTRHLRCDVFEADPREVCRGRGVRVLHASPDCTHFSVAKGGKPVSRRRRSLAWIVVRWAGTVRPETITLENVSEIQTWGPLIAKRDPATGRVVRLNGTVAAKGERVPVAEQWLVPDPRHRGRIWRAWLRHLADLGYSFEGRVLVCADFGVPTIRKRFFGVAKADGSPIEWPARTHAPRDKAKALKLSPWVGAHTCIDWSIPMRSIFDRPKPLAEATLRRTARGVMRYVVEAREPFIVPITHSGGGNRGHGVGEPLRTITTAHRGEMAVIAPHVAKFRTHSTGSDMHDPMPTITANSFETRPGGAIPIGVAAANLIQTGYGERAGQAPRTRDVGEPMATIVPTGNEGSLVAAVMVKNNFGEKPHYAVDEPVRTIVAGGTHHMLVAGHIQRQFGASVGSDAEEPIGTTTAGGGGKSAVVAAFLAQHNLGMVGHDVREPVSTIATKGSQQAFAAVLGDMRGRSPGGRDAAEPMTAPTAGSHAHLILAFLQTYYSSGGQDQAIDDPLRAVTAKARHGLVTIDVRGEPRFIDDIMIRMLEPEEGARAHGFLDGCLPDEITIDGKTRRLTKTEKYHLVGNSVPPRMVQLLAECNVRRELVAEAAE